MHCCVTDPPYGLKFMGKKWDYAVPTVDVWREVLRVLRPGGYLLSFAGTRTQHRMAVNIEDAGFEIRDMIAWVYGSGFPKSLDIGKAVDKLQGNERESLGVSVNGSGAHQIKLNNHDKGDTGIGYMDGSGKEFEVTKGSSQWEGYGTALKPAFEPITVARKPLEGTVAENVLKWGTGGINIDGCRIDGEFLSSGGPTGFKPEKGWHQHSMKQMPPQIKQGRFPANFIHDGSEEVVRLFPQSKGQQGDVKGTENSHTGDDNANCYGEYGRIPTPKRNDNGSAARFFYAAKASKSERGEGNNHPTVKPLALMEYLVKLASREGDIVLDPYCGSGSTLIATKKLNRFVIGIDRDPDYVAISQRRTLKMLGGLF